MEEVESGGCTEKFAGDLGGFLGPCSLLRSHFFALLWKDCTSPQLRLFPAWGSPQMARLASKLASHSTGCGGGGPSPADGGESHSENYSLNQGWTLFVLEVLRRWSKSSRYSCEPDWLLSPSSLCLQEKIQSLQYHTEVTLCSCWSRSPWSATERDPCSGYWRVGDVCRTELESFARVAWVRTVGLRYINVVRAVASIQAI